VPADDLAGGPFSANRTQTCRRELNLITTSKMPSASVHNLQQDLKALRVKFRVNIIYSVFTVSHSNFQLKRRVQFGAVGAC
jgi:hypothetical protein